jgi:hypothetical protein
MKIIELAFQDNIIGKGLLGLVTSIDFSILNDFRNMPEIQVIVTEVLQRPHHSTSKNPAQ